MYGIIFMSINIISFALMAYDKYLAINNKFRISEKTLLLSAFCFGATGVFLAMKKPVNHKGAKPVFIILVPVFIILNLVTGYYILNNFL